MSDTQTTSKKPAFNAFTVEEREGKDAYWTKIGAAYGHKDKDGMTIVLSALPADKKIVLRRPKKSN